MQDRALDAILGPPEQVVAAFDSLMPRRVNNLVLVSSLYDRYTFIAAGRLLFSLWPTDPKIIVFSALFAPSAASALSC